MRTGGCPRGPARANVKIWLEGCTTKYFRARDRQKIPEYRGGFEPIPDVVIFHEDIKGDWTRRNYLETARCLLLAVEVKVSERQGSRLQPGEIIDDIEKLAAFKEELRHRGTKMVPVMLVVDTAREPEGRMTEFSFQEVRDHSRALEVPFFYCGPDRCVVPEPGMRLGSRYTEAEFMDRLEHQAGPDAVPVARALLDWGTRNSDKVLWGRGKVWGSFSPVVVIDGSTQSIGLDKGHGHVHSSTSNTRRPSRARESGSTSWHG